MAKSRFKRFAGWLHLWLGLITGLVVMVVSLTGCIYVFDQEIFAIAHRNLVKVAPQKKPLPLSKLVENVQKALGADKTISTVTLSGATNSYVFSAIEQNKPENRSLTYFGQFAYLDQIYVNQYTGKVLGIIDMRYEFFNVVEKLHRQLLLTKNIGSPIVGYSILIFLVMLITGFVLWLPKNYKQFKKSTSIKWRAKWKRVNYDMHNSLGFWVWPLAMLIAVTGLVWSFRWWEAGIYQMLGTKTRPKFATALPNISVADTALNKTDQIISTLLPILKGNWNAVSLSIPTKKDKVATAYVDLKTRTDGWRGVSYYFFDGRTAKLIKALPHSNKTLGMKWRNSNLGIHTGRIYGWWTQILAFVASLICASLPVSGFLIWWGKRFKKKRPSSVPSG